MRIILTFAVVFLLSACSRFKGEPVALPSAPPPLLQDVAGTVVVLGFGYTSCPDVCPTALARMKSLLKTLGPDADRVSLAFVSVDPDRDDPARLEQYVKSFDARIIPVWISARELPTALNSYGVVATVHQSIYGETLTIDHTSGFLVLDGKGQVRLRFAPDMAEADMASDVRRLVAELPAAPALKVAQPEVRIMPSGVGALYVKVANAGVEDRLLRVETAAAKSAELHETVFEGDVARMLPRPEGFVVPAGGSLELSPGGKHVMLFGVGGDREKVDATLVFERAGPVKATFALAR